jgi:hypothetical protein
MFQPNHLKSINYRTDRSDTFPYPYENFIPETYHLDPEADHLFLYGYRKKEGDSSLLSKNFSRYLIIFNLKTQTFFPFLYRFPKSIYDFDTLEKPDVRSLPSGLLAIQHPKRLEIYETNFPTSTRAR